jgi:hypothetical protein
VASLRYKKADLMMAGGGEADRRGPQTLLLWEWGPASGMVILKASGKKLKKL